MSCERMKATIHKQKPLNRCGCCCCVVSVVTITAAVTTVAIITCARARPHILMRFYLRCVVVLVCGALPLPVVYTGPVHIWTRTCGKDLWWVCERKREWNLFFKLWLYGILHSTHTHICVCVCGLASNIQNTRSFYLSLCHSFSFPFASFLLFHSSLLLHLNHHQHHLFICFFFASHSFWGTWPISYGWIEKSTASLKVRVKQR